MTSKKARKHARYGFTMVELMAMLIIIGLLMALVATKVIPKIEQARVTTTKANLKMLHSAVTATWKRRNCPEMAGTMTLSMSSIRRAASNLR